MTPCSPSQIGPINIWSKENSVSSSYPVNESNKIQYSVQEACINGSYTDGQINTKFLKVTGASVDPGKWKYLWNEKAPPNTSSQFDFLFATYTLNKYIQDISALKVYEEGLENIFLKAPIAISVSETTYANAAFSPSSYSIFFGMVMSQCSFGADGDVVLHEFAHLLTYSKNPYLGMLYKDYDGGAIHEALSDITPAVYFNDPEMAESLTVCLKLSENESETIGIRNLSEKQLNLDIENEPHHRSLYFSPYLWSCFEKLSELMGENKAFASDIMLMFIHNIPEFLPSIPKEGDLPKAFLNAIMDVTGRNTFHWKYMASDKAKEFAKKFGNIVIEEAKAFNLLPKNKPASEIVNLYPYIKENEAGAVIKKFTTSENELKKEYEKGRQIFYQQYFKGKKLLGCGLKFIKTQNGIQVINMIEKTDALSATKTLSATNALSVLKTSKTPKKIMESLLVNVKNGTLEKKDLKYIMTELKNAKKIESPVEVYLPGNPNVQYMFDIPGVITVYVDSNTGELSLSKQKFF